MRRALALFLLLAAAVVFLLFSENERGSAREPVPRAHEAPLARTDILASAAPEEPAGEPEARLLGTVRDADGHPFAGARVRLFVAGEEPEAWRDAPSLPEEPLAVTMTDTEGRFAVTSEAGPARMVVADADGFVPAFRHVRRGAPVGDALVLRAPVACRLRIVDTEGAPVPDAEALVFQGCEALRIVARPDAQGWIEAELAPRELVLVRAPGRASELVEPPLDPPEVVLETEHRIGGVVVTGDGLPAAHVRLSFERYLWIDHVVTKADGSFLVGGFGENEVELMVHPPGREWRWETVQPGDERCRIVVPTARIEGVVLLPDGRPAAAAGVDAGDGGVICGADGSFALDDVPPGETEIRATFRAPGLRLEGRVLLDVGGAHVTGVRIALQPAPLSFVRVSVVGPRGTPVDADVRGTGDPWWRCEWRPEGPGTGILEVDAEPGTDLLLAGAERDPGPGARRLLGRALAVTRASGEGPPVTLRLDPPEPPRPQVTVTVVCREADGSALPFGARTHASIEGLPARPLGPDGPGRHRFQIPAGENGPGALVVRAPGYAPVRLGEWTPPSAGGEVEIRLRAAVRIVGRIIDPDATEGEVDLVVVGEISSSTFGPSGRFSLDAGPGDRVTIVARRGPVPGLVTSLEVPSHGPVDLGDIRLGKPWVLRGAVVHEDGTPAGGAAVIARGPGYEGKCVTRGDGSFRLEAPPSDLFEVAAEKGLLASDAVPASTLLREAQPLRLRPLGR